MRRGFLGKVTGIFKGKEAYNNMLCPGSAQKFGVVVLIEGEKWEERKQVKRSRSDYGEPRVPRQVRGVR